MTTPTEPYDTHRIGTDHRDEMRPARRRGVAWWVIAGLVVILGLIAALVVVLTRHPSTPSSPANNTTPSSPAAAVATFTMNGTFDVFTTSANGLAPGAPCKGSGASSDIADGTPVTVFDVHGKQLASGELTGGHFVNASGTTACVFSWVADDVPDGLSTYSVEVGQEGVKKISSSAARGQVFLLVGP